MKGEVQKPDSRIESVGIVFAGGWMSVCVWGGINYVHVCVILSLWVPCVMLWCVTLGMCQPVHVVS